MITQGKDNFVVRHYDWIVAGIAVLALGASAVFFALSLGNDATTAASEAVAAIDRKKPTENGVEKMDITPFSSILRWAKSPVQLVEVAADRENFLASERRVKCRCGHVMPAGLEKCPSCQASLIVVNAVDEEAKKVDSWKARYGVSADDQDKDGDGFTNLEEYRAQTDPTDAKDHPDYADSVRVDPTLKETFVPFVLTKATQIPTGWRCEFFDPKRKDDYGRPGRSFTAIVGDEISVPMNSSTGVTKNEPTGYVLKSFEKKEERRAITAGSSMQKSVDTSVATVMRKSDGKTVQLVLQSNRKKVRLSPIDVQATLVYNRMGTKKFEVVTGDEVDLNGMKYRIASVKTAGTAVQVVLENKVTGKQKMLKPLE